MTLENLRQQIDAVDGELLELLKKRIGFVRQVGQLKVESGEQKSMIRPAREATMMRKLVSAGSNIFSSGIIYSIWRAIIAGSTQSEAPFSLSILQGDEGKTAYWLAREYFGSDTPCRFFNQSLPLLHDTKTNANVVGIVPLMHQKFRPWWVELADMPDAPSVFATLPFIGKTPFEIPTILALARVPAEASGNDNTLAVVGDTKSISRESIQQHFMKQGIPSRDIFKHEEGVNRHQLFELTGFFTNESTEIQAVLMGLNALNASETSITIRVIGQYAV